jgi:RNase P/RNase MRP subunit p30
MIINTSDLNEARKQIQKFKQENQIAIVRAKDHEFNRKILENANVNLLLGPEIHSRKDGFKQRDSGLNEILCKLAAKNNIKIGIDFDSLKGRTNKEKAVIISRIMQNIKICRKTGVKIIFYSENKYPEPDIIAFLQALGSSTQQAKEALR